MQIAFQHAVTYVAARLAGMDHAKAHIVVLALVLGCSWPVDGAARACVEFRGVFDTALSGLIRCSAQGQTAEQPLSAFGTSRVRQRGCTFRFVPPRGTGQRGFLRGTIRGRRIRLNRSAPPSIPDFHIDTFDFGGRGLISRSGERATINFSFRLEGEFQGQDTTCTVSARARLLRHATAAENGPNPGARAFTDDTTVPALMDAVGLATLAARMGLPDPEWRIAAAGDLDGDGRTDIVWRHFGTGEHEVWLNEPGGPARVRLDCEPDPDWRVAAMADLDGDGRADLVWRNATDGAGEVWLMDGSEARERWGLPSLDPRKSTVP